MESKLALSVAGYALQQLVDGEVRDGELREGGPRGSGGVGVSGKYILAVGGNALTVLQVMGSLSQYEQHVDMRFKLLTEQSETRSFRRSVALADKVLTVKVWVS